MSDALERQLDAVRAREAALGRRVRELQAQLLAAEEEVARAGEAELERDEARAEAAEHRRRVEVLEADVRERDELLARGRRVHEEMQRSLSWRVTAPLRAVRRR